MPRSALYTPGSGNTLLVREGQLAPGTAGATFANSFDTWQAALSPDAFNNSGQYVMTAELQGGDVVDGVNDSALYVGSASGNLTMVARKGDPAPGTDALFAGFVTNNTYINNAGVVLTVASLMGGTSSSANNAAVYVATPTGNPGAPYTLSLIMRAGDPAPGRRATSSTRVQPGSRPSTIPDRPCSTEISGAATRCSVSTTRACTPGTRSRGCSCSRAPGIRSKSPPASSGPSAASGT